MPDKFELSNAALADLESLGGYTQKRYGRDQRKKYLSQLHNCFIQLSKNPHLGHERPDIKPGYRSVVEGKHVIFYRVKDTSIEIIRVLHGYMDLKRQIERSRRKDRSRGDNDRER